MRKFSVGSSRGRRSVQFPFSGPAPSRAALRPRNRKSSVSKDSEPDDSTSSNFKDCSKSSPRVIPFHVAFLKLKDC